MDGFTKLVVVAVSAGVIAVVAGGVFAAKEAEKVVDAVVDAAKEDVEKAKEWWEREFDSGGAGAQGWLFLLGSDVYNPKGFPTGAGLQELINNSQALFDKYGEFVDYYKTLSPKAQAVLGSWRGAPLQFYPNTFSVRQNLCFMPFASALSGPGLKPYEPGACQKLQNYIWSFWDKIPAIDEQLAATGDAYQIDRGQRELRAIIVEDEARMAAFAKQNDSRSRIVEDRIKAMRVYLRVPAAALLGTASQRGQADQSSLEASSRIAASSQQAAQKFADYLASKDD